jgi:hypothetical protein
MAQLAFSVSTPAEPLTCDIASMGGIVTFTCADGKLRLWLTAESRLAHTLALIGAARRRGVSSSMMPRVAHGTEKSGSVAESCRDADMSGGLSHCRPLIIVDNVPPESIRAAAHDIACRASKVNILAVGTFAIN